MAERVVPSSATRQANSPALCADPPDNALVPQETWQDKELVLMRRALREAIEESREKKEAIAAAMGLTDPAYLSKIFSGEKPLTARHIVGLPEKVEKIFARKYAEGKGLVVVDEAPDEDIALRNFVSGLVGLIKGRRRLPTRASAMATVRPARRVAKAGLR